MPAKPARSKSAHAVKSLTGTLGVLAGALAGFTAGTVGFGWAQLAKARPRRTLAASQNRALPGIQWERSRENPQYTLTHCLENGIETIHYVPKQPRFKTPILLQHGMWHGAWCWRLWQELFAEWGWESIAISLPGHGASPVQRPVELCTLDYYLSFVRDAAARLPRPPVLMGHSMGGALLQWYLKYVGDDLPAAVSVAGWVSHNAFLDGLPRFLKLAPQAVFEMPFAFSATPFVRTPARAARLLISPRAVYSPAELQARLGPESALVMQQHNPPFWYPPEKVTTPLLWVAAEEDAVISVAGARNSAAFYQADWLLVPEAGHNLMLEHNYHQTAEQIHRWLVQQGIQ